MPSLLPQREDRLEDVGMRRVDVREWQRTIAEPEAGRRVREEEYQIRLKKEEEKRLPFEKKEKKRRLNI